MKKAIKYTNEPIKARIIKDFLPRPSELRFRQSAMKVTYDTRSDILHVRLQDGLVSESDEVAKGVSVDYNKKGEIMGIELLKASKRASNPKALEFAVA
jgi:uncharacterized protein YuzE